MKVSEDVHLSISLLFLVFELYFAWKGLKRVGGYKTKSLLGGKVEVLNHAIFEPWKTKYHWAGIIQLIMLFLIIYWQF